MIPKKSLKTTVRVITFLILFAGFTVKKAQAQYLPDETPETILKNSVGVNASELDDFHEGYAIIRKGEGFSLIDKDGNAFFPYGKYKFNMLHAFGIDKERCGFHNGMCVVRDPDSEMYGYVDLKGKLIVPCTLIDAGPFMEDGYAWAKRKDAQGREEQIYIDKAGNKYPLKNQSLYNHNILQAYAVSGMNGYNEFYSKSGKYLFKTKRWYRDGFSEGLLKVDTNYEMAGRKIGFMDITGKLAIPYKFKAGSLRGFHEGLAFYEPPTSDEFKYIFINKEGEEVIKLHSTSEFEDLFFDNGQFIEGFAIGSSKNKPVLLDKSGKLSFITDLIEQNNPEFTSKYKQFEVDHNSLRRYGAYIKFEARLRYEVPYQFISGGVGGGRTVNTTRTIDLISEGIADRYGKIVIPPVYTNVGVPDPVSGLAKVSYTVSQKDKEVRYDGYASQSKVFAIVINRN